MNLEIKKLNFYNQFTRYAIFSDVEYIENSWTLAQMFSDSDCIFRYDLADGVTIKEIITYLNQYWKGYWLNYDCNTMLDSLILEAMKKDGLVKYAPNLPDEAYHEFYDFMFFSLHTISEKGDDCPYAE